MTDLTPENLTSIVATLSTLSTLHRAGAMETSNESTIAGRNILIAAFVVGGSTLMLKQSIDGISNELWDLMHSNDDRLNQLHNTLLEFVRAFAQNVRLSDSNAEALLMRLNGIAEQLGDAVPELAGAIESVGTNIGAGIALAFEHALKTVANENTDNP